MKLQIVIITSLIISLIKGDFIKLNFYKDNYKSPNVTDNLFFSYMATDIYIGTPPHRISLQISTDSPYQVIKGNASPGEYKQENSSTFYFMKYGHSYEYKNIYFHSIIFQDNFILDDKKVNLISMMYWGKYPITPNFGLLGLQLYDNKFQEPNIFINQLYNKDLIEEKMFTLIYEDENRGELFIGDLPTNKTKLLKGKKFKICNNTFITDGLIYGTIFEEIKFIDKDEFVFKNIKYKESNYMALFSNCYYGYIGSKEYGDFIYKTFFRAKLESKSCWIQNINNDKFYGYVCKKKVDMSIIYNILFYHKALNHTFEIENEEMWVEYNNAKYFLIFFSYANQYSWTLGQKFLQKYTFVFNGETNVIGFYYSDKKIKKWNYKLYLIMIILIILICIFIYFRFFHHNKNKIVEDGIELKDLLILKK